MISTIVTAVEEGRRIYSNVLRTILYNLSSNFAEIFLIIVGMIFTAVVYLLFVYMKLNRVLTLAFLTLFAVSGLQAQSLSPDTKTRWDKGTLVVETPARPEGQQHVLGLKAPRLKTVRVAFVGLGMRGPDGGSPAS